jgi:hypothetical protein
MKASRAPLLLAILLLVLPVLYVGSYLALVVPDGSLPSDYRWGGETAEKIFWPLMRIDRKVRPAEWGRQLRTAP